MRDKNNYINPLETPYKDQWEESLMAFRQPRRRKEHQKLIEAIDSGSSIRLDKRLAEPLTCTHKIHRFVWRAAIGKHGYFNEEAQKWQPVECLYEKNEVIFETTP